MAERRKIDPQKVKNIILSLRKAGYSAAKIGLILRDQYGIGDVKAVCGKSITAIIAESERITIPEDLLALLTRAIRLMRHLRAHPRDKKNKFALAVIESKIRRLGKYYVRKKRLPPDWKYVPEKAELLIR